MSNIYIIGAGAAGFFLAITLREISPATHVTLVERASQPLTKADAMSPILLRTSTNSKRCILVVRA